MKKVLFMLVALAAIPALSPTPAAAADRRFCLTYFDREGMSPAQCYYDTMAQCRASASGAGGACDENPVYTAQNSQLYGDQYAPQSRKHHRASY